jgi:hypothetical protein
MKITRLRNKTNPVWAPFKTAVLKTFQFLVDDYGFEQVSDFEWMPDCELQFRNQTTRLKVRYEWKQLVDVGFSKVKLTPSGPVDEKPYDLLFLIQLRAPEIDPTQFYGKREWTDHYVERLLSIYATFLNERARDILTGDFNILPEVKKLAAQKGRQYNKEVYGTYAGITPRFTSRPTLPEVFEIAHSYDPSLEELFGGKLDQDKTTDCIYEAFWDHEYSIKEIASYLNTDEESIQRALNESEERL